MVRKAFSLAAVSFIGSASAVLVLHIDDFANGIGDRGDTPPDTFGADSALVVNTLDTSDANPAGVTLTGPNPSGNRAASFNITSTFGAVGGSAFSAAAGDLLRHTVTDSVFADFSYQYDFSSVFDATGGGPLDSVELAILSSDWQAGKGSLSVSFTETAASGSTATWNIAAPVTGTSQSAMSSLTGAASVDFSTIEQVTLDFFGVTTLDFAASELGPVGSITEPSSALLIILGSGFLVGRRRRSLETTDRISLQTASPYGLAVCLFWVRGRLFLMGSGRSYLSLCGMIALLVGALPAQGHHDPATEAAALSAEMQAKGASVKALCERARLWRTLRKLDLAIDDLAKAAALDPKSVSVRHLLAQAYYADGQLEPAFDVLEKGLLIAEKAEDKASLLMMRASIYLLWKSYPKAMNDCESAFAALPGHRRIEWYLRRAYAQRMAGSFMGCVEGLKEGFSSTGSMVLYTQWVDALVDVKAYDEALAEISKQLPGLRFAASWRIRQALAFQGLGKDEEARAELNLALEELNVRIRPEADYPDVTLLGDRGLAHLLLGDRKAARRDYSRAKEAGAMAWMHWRLAKTFG
jgi:tetratricopeptide (TPR) repeat protein